MGTYLIVSHLWDCNFEFAALTSSTMPVCTVHTNIKGSDVPGDYIIKLSALFADMLKKPIQVGLGVFFFKFIIYQVFAIWRTPTAEISECHAANDSLDRDDY